MDGERAVFGKSVCYLNGECSGVVFFSVGACVCKDERRLAVGIRFNNIPNLCVESVFSAVEGVVSVILVKLVFLALKSELSAADTVAYTSDESALISSGCEVAFKIVKTAYYVGFNTVLVLDPDILDNSAVA